MSETPIEVARPHEIHDYLAEMFVAGQLADVGWNPRRDKGFDCIVTKEINGQTIIKPIQVKGKYPTAGKTDKSVYGYVGKLSLTHSDMVLAIVYFERGGAGRLPLHVAYMPFDRIKPHTRGFHCQPAQFRDGKILPRPEFRQYFDAVGLACWEAQRAPSES